MKLIKFLTAGIFFGIILSKAEVVSWFRIYEMFRFESFHMYGIIGSAIVLGIIFIQSVKRKSVKSMYGEDMEFIAKSKSYWRYILGGIIFGLGWALTGACPAPMFILVGHGFGIFLIVILAAIAGTLSYGFIRHKLPH
jgi:hypothetical protein